MRHRRALSALVISVFALFGVACVPSSTGPAPFPGPDWNTYSYGSAYIHKSGVAICVRAHESDRGDYNHNGLHDGGYQAANPTSSARGAFQFLQSTWDSNVAAMGREGIGRGRIDYGALVGRNPATVGIVWQDEVFWYVYKTQGTRPWAGSGC